MKLKYKIKAKNSSIDLVVIWVIISIFLFMPDDLFEKTALYSVSTPYHISYKWLNYHFSYLFLIPVIMGIMIMIATRKIKGLLLTGAILLREILRGMIFGTSIFIDGYYEIVLTFLVGISLFQCVHYILEIKKTISWKFFFLTFVWLHVLSQLLSFCFSLSHIVSRYNAVNLDVEATGLLTNFAFLYLYVTDTVHVYAKKILLIFFLTGGLLSGARIPMVLNLFLLLIYTVFKKKKLSGIKINSITISFFLIAVGIMLLLALIRPELYAGLFQSDIFSTVNRFQDAINGTNNSLGGRYNSICVGWQVLKDNPLGLECAFLPLQEKMNKFGYPTFPHSFLLTYYLLLGPLLFMSLLVNFFREILKKIIKKNSRLSSLIKVLMLILFLAFSGGPIVNYKVIFVYLLLYKMALLEEKKNNDIYLFTCNFSFRRARIIASIMQDTK